MQGHGNVVAERIVVGHAHHEVHDDQGDPRLEGHHRANSSKLGGENKSLYCYHQELGESDQVSDARILAFSNSSSD